MKRLISSFLGVALIGTIAIVLAIRYLEHHNLVREQAAHLKRADISITIIEGKRREEIARQLDEAGICSTSDFLTASQGLEGYLFPDTYRFFPNTSATQVVKTMTDDFAARTAQNPPTKDQLILASIVEREAAGDTDRAGIAGVYQNRLNLNMLLEADPTVQYARDTQESTSSLPNPVDGSTSATFQYWKPITQLDYSRVISPYNTYLNKGLPPGPIANPGLKSILAAENPTQSQYLYFVHKNGTIYYAKTLDEHIQQINN